MTTQQTLTIAITMLAEVPPISTTHHHHHHHTMIHDINNDLLLLSHAFLGVGHFRYHNIACKMFLRASEEQPGYTKITTGEIATFSISCAQKYFEDEGTAKKQRESLWDNAARRHGCVEVMQWAHQQGYSVVWGSNTCQRAAKYGQLQALQWLRENGCNWNEDTCSAAAQNGPLACLQWVRENGCDWNEDTCNVAARYGHLLILLWARENGCDWNHNTCLFAAENGHLSCLQWATENSCDWHMFTCAFAAQIGHISILQWR